MNQPLRRYDPFGGFITLASVIMDVQPLAPVDRVSDSGKMFGIVLTTRHAQDTNPLFDVALA